MMAGPMPTEKLKDFRGSSRRLLGMLRPDRLIIAVVLAFGAASVTLSVIGPRLLGHATDVIFAGILGRSLPRSSPSCAPGARAAARTSWRRPTSCRARASTSAG
jgi:ATP-binding cassette subfamily B protein